ncbi:hypothetical protein CQA66_02825 [Helicobacter aurati]|uniref:Lipopolysaccharide heptosyltransferase family protein n=2 Tax=Helicobacter aurati TaxID=137778 RepID=A0A3D8J8J4_9HELI|nr:hypothetical protein CQA66_02825 [Helicobacter aurati]
MRGFTCFILTQPNRAKCKLLMRTNVKRIVTFRTLWNLTRVRFETIFISRNLSNIPQYQRILRLVWKIDPAHYKANFKFIDFSAIRLASQESNKVTISQFLAAHNIQSPLVIVNPFVRSTHCNLSIDGYCLLIRRLASSYPQIGIVIPTYKDNVDISLSLRDLHNVAIFCNDSDLLNIVALLESSSLLISPSTGISHIANNLRIPMVWLCSKRDRHLWMGDAMNPEFFVMLKQPTGKMSKQVEEHYISLVMKKFSVLIETFLNRS